MRPLEKKNSEGLQSASESFPKSDRKSFLRGLVVSIHDVAPQTQDAVEQMLSCLRQLGVSRCSLLVIPDYHHKGRFDRDADFCRWLRLRREEGHETVLHGYFHQRERSSDDGCMRRLITEHYTAGEGEFYNLSRKEATERLQRGLEVFSAAGLSSSGFIAPAWLLGREAEKAVREMGFRYTVRIQGITDFAKEHFFPSRSLVYSVRALWRRKVSLIWNTFLEKRVKSREVVRFSLHPPDMRHAEIWDHAQRCIQRMLAEREPMTYESWVCSQK